MVYITLHEINCIHRMHIMVENSENTLLSKLITNALFLNHNIKDNRLEQRKRCSLV